MNNEEFLRGKEIYNKLSQEKHQKESKRESRLLEIEAKMKLLEEDEKVKEYASLQFEKIKINNEKALSPSTRQSEFKIIYTAFNDICKNTQDSNNIYVYMGFTGLIYKYKNIETTEDKYVEFDKHWEFLENNEIIFSPYPNTKIFFETVRTEYLTYLSQFTPKTAVDKVLKLGVKQKLER